MQRGLVVVLPQLETIETKEPAFIAVGIKNALDIARPEWPPPVRVRIESRIFPA